MKRPLALLLLLGFCAVTAFGQKEDAKKNHDGAVEAVAANERAFAKRCGVVGIRDSFVEYFADDCTVFVPEPVNGKEFYGKRPPGKGLVELVWGPEFVDVSAGGDLGYSTGPTVFTKPSDPKFKTAYGYYFSLWRKQADGTWKVEVDIGTSTPQGNPIPKDVEHGAFIAKNAKTTPRTPHSPEWLKEIQDREQQFIREVGAKGPKATYPKFIGVSFRRHFPDLMPLKGGDSLWSHLEDRSEVKMGLTRYESSNTGDLFYTYGEYSAAVKAKDGAKKEQGYYLHVWKKEGGALKLVAEVFSLKV